MLLKLLALAVVFGAVVAESVQKRTFSSSNDVVYSEHGTYQMAAQPNASLLIDVVSALIGYKTSALALAVTTIEWIVSNFFVILIGAATALGFCKITGKCALNYEEFIPVTQIQGLVTPENIHAAEKFLFTAVEKYAEEKKRSA